MLSEKLPPRKIIETNLQTMKKSQTAYARMYHASVQSLREGNAAVGRRHAESFTDQDDIGIQRDEIDKSELLDLDIPEGCEMTDPDD